MKKILFLLALSFATLLWGTDLKDVDPDQLLAMQKRGIPVIDIRTASEWRETGIIPDSHPITFFHTDGRYDLKDFLQRIQRLGIDRSKPFILVCRSASRTKTLGNYLAGTLGYRVYELKGGILNWRAQGKPLVAYRH